jgi:hypothetical protein
LITFREDSKIASLTRQTASETNVLEFTAAIEQKAVDIISEYEMCLRCKNKNVLLSPGMGPSSPAPLAGRLFQ